MIKYVNWLLRQDSDDKNWEGGQNCQEKQICGDWKYFTNTNVILSICIK
jgi:hypothetical protein